MYIICSRCVNVMDIVPACVGQTVAENGSGEVFYTHAPSSLCRENIRLHSHRTHHHVWVSESAAHRGATLARNTRPNATMRMQTEGNTNTTELPCVLWKCQGTNR